LVSTRAEFSLFLLFGQAAVGRKAQMAYSHKTAFGFRHCAIGRYAALTSAP
jgi:hypothetical protein